MILKKLCESTEKDSGDIVPGKANPWDADSATDETHRVSKSLSVV